MDFKGKIEIWREELIGGYQVFPPLFNPNNSPLSITSNFTPIHV